jgi:hypothetical protein
MISLYFEMYFIFKKLFLISLLRFACLKKRFSAFSQRILLYVPECRMRCLRPGSSFRAAQPVVNRFGEFAFFKKVHPSEFLHGRDDCSFGNSGIFHNFSIADTEMT